MLINRLVLKYKWHICVFFLYTIITFLMVYMPGHPDPAQSEEALMYTPLRDDSLPSRIPTGHLPPPEEVEALVCEAIGCEVARGKIGVNATGLPFNSAMAVEVTR